MSFKNGLNEIFVDGVYAMGCGAAISVMTPFEWWRVGVALFGAVVLTQFMWTNLARR